MKTIGLIGGTSWESSIEYYRILNETVKEKLGGRNSAKIILFSVNFEEIMTFKKLGQKKKIAELLINAAKTVENAGADVLLLGANTIHSFADLIQKNISISILHIADATAEKIKEKGFNKIGLLGTKVTMEEEFYKKRLKEKHGIDVVVPDEEDRQLMDDIIFNELVLGKFLDSSKATIIEMMHKLSSQGAEGIILGCTEIPLIIKQDDCQYTLFDTTAIHSKAAVEFALK